MKRLKDILEPGERIVGRDPEAFVQWLMRIALAVFLLIAASFVADAVAETDWFEVSLWLAAGLFMLFQVWSPSGEKFRWQSAITNRRLIYRSDGDNGYESVPLTEIEIVEPRDRFESITPEGVRLAKLVGTKFLKDRLIGLRHGEQVFGFDLSKRNVARIRDAITGARP